MQSSPPPAWVYVGMVASYLVAGVAALTSGKALCAALGTTATLVGEPAPAPAGAR